MNVTQLQELYSRALARRNATGSDACVTPEDLLGLVRKDGPEARRLEILDHVMGCPACQRANPRSRRRACSTCRLTVASGSWPNARFENSSR